MRIKTAVCTLAFVIGVASGTFAAAGGEAAPSPCPGRMMWVSVLDDPTGLATYDTNQNGMVCVSKDGNRITDDRIGRKH